MGFVFVGLGAFIGACARYGITKLSNTVFQTEFPIGTLLSNVLAGILIGFILQASLNRWQLADTQKLFLTTGMLGGLSTMSTLSMETIQLFQNNQTVLGVANIVLNLGLSILGVLVGMWVANMVYAR